MKRVIFIFLLFTQTFSFGQLGSIDTLFNKADKGNGLGFGTTNKVSAIEVLNNNELLLLFNGSVNYNFRPMDGIVKVNADGALNTSFSSGTGFQGINELLTVCILPSGNILIGGKFDSYNKSLNKRLVMLNPDGSKNTSFITTGFSDATNNEYVTDIIRQQDGKFIVVGKFSMFQGKSVGNIIRLNEDGSLDETFITGTGLNGSADKVTLQADGKIIVGGNFSDYNGTTKRSLIRLTPNGNIDDTFDASGGIVTGILKKILVQQDGRILVAGDFNNFNNESLNAFIRLLPDGSIDPSFSFNSANGDIVTDICPTASGKFLVTGELSNFSSALIQINEDGSIDPSFNIGSSISKATFVKVLSTNKIIVTGLDAYGDYEQNGIARLNSDGSLDKSFNENTGLNNSVKSIGIFDDGSIMAAGAFRLFNKHIIPSYVKLTTEGTFEENFFYGAGSNGSINTLAAYHNNTMLIGGEFTSFQNVAVPSIVRIVSSGEIDPSFVTSGISIGVVTEIIVQPDGKILVAHNGDGGLVRLNADGSYDPGFLQNKLNGFPTAIAVDYLGNIIVAGYDLYGYESIERKSILRLKADGTLDESFDPGEGFQKPLGNEIGGVVSFFTSFSINDIAVDSYGEILVAGDFAIYNNTWVKKLVRLKFDGTVDLYFNSRAGIDFQYEASLVKVLASGNIIASGVTVGGIKMYSSFGYDIDEFKTGKGFNGYALAIEEQKDGSLVIGGLFSRYDTTYKNSLIRMNSHLVHISDWTWFDGAICKGKNLDFDISASGTYGDSNQFIIELSNKDGQFTAPIEVARISNEQYNYSIENKEHFLPPFPKNLPSGEHYALRITSTSPVVSDIELSEIVFINPNASASKVDDQIIASPDNASYQWLNCKDQFSEINGATLQTFVSEPNQSYAVVVEVDGCKDTTSCIETTVISAAPAAAQINFEIYPNPVSSIVTIDGLLVNHTITIVNQTGVEVYSEFVNNSTHKEINMEALRKGIYFLRISDNESSQSHKIIRQ